MNELDRDFDRIFVTGDIHGDVLDLSDRIDSLVKPTKNDLVILLGDCGFFFDCFFRENHPKDKARREYAAKLPATILCIQGNHEVPFAEMDAEKIELLGGDGYFKQGIYFAKNGTELWLNDKRAIVMGGAYSVDKDYRLAYGYPYWENEELSLEEIERILARAKGKKFDFVLSHTCASSDLPTHAFLDGIDQRKVSTRMENALERLKATIKYNMWYCGHFHIDFLRKNVRFLYHDIEQIV